MHHRQFGRPPAPLNQIAHNVIGFHRPAAFYIAHHGGHDEGACPELDENETAEEPDRGRFVWLNQKKTVLGNLRISSGELTLGANSRQRLVRGKQLLLGLAGNSLRHVRGEHATQKELKRRAAESRETMPPEPSIPKHVRDEVAGRFLAEHYAKWPDEKLPALAGKTPHQAVKTASGRLQVLDLLKLIENGEEHKRLRGDPFYDVELLRSELGLE